MYFCVIDCVAGWILKLNMIDPIPTPSLFRMDVIYHCPPPAGREEERGAAELGVEGQLHHAHLPEVGEAGGGRLRRPRPPRPTAEHLLGGLNSVLSLDSLNLVAKTQI